MSGEMCWPERDILSNWMEENDGLLSGDEIQTLARLMTQPRIDATQQLESQLSECQRELAEYKRLFEEAQKQEPKAWMNPMNDVVIDAKRKVQIGDGNGYPNFSIPLYRAPIPAQPAHRLSGE